MLCEILRRAYAVFLGEYVDPATSTQKLIPETKYLKEVSPMSMTFTEAVEKFLAEASWLSGADAPMVASLQIMAAQLDKRFSAATMAQFGLSFRYLAKKAPADEGTKDPLERLLDNE